MKNGIRRILALAPVVLLATAPAWADTVINLQNGNVDYIDYGTYSNFFELDQPAVINGVNFLVSITFHSNPDMTFDPDLSSIQFWNQVDNTRVDIPLTGTISTYASGINAKPVIQGFFSGAYSGSFTLNLYAYYGYHHRLYWAQTHSTLTLD